MGSKDNILAWRGANWDICRRNISKPELAVDLQSQRLWMIQTQSLAGTRRPCRGSLLIRKTRDWVFECFESLRASAAVVAESVEQQDTTLGDSVTMRLTSHKQASPPDSLFI
jgi:hypothetical protein